MIVSALLWFLSLATSWALCTLIWLIQILHYPSFSFVHPDHFPTFHAFHSQRISLIVLPLMVVELGSSIYLAWHLHSIWLVSLFLVILIWMSTFLIQVPLHGKLSARKDQRHIEKLVRTNWIRTFLWSLKAILISYLYLTTL